MDYLKSHIRLCTFPTLATVGFLLLLMHKSEFPAVFNRYSINYTILLILSALNLGLFWWKSVLRVSYQRLIERLSPGPVLSFLVVVISVIFLIDFVIGIGAPHSPRDWIRLGLLGVLLFQVEASRERSIFTSSHLALLASSLAVTVILLEVVFVLCLAERQTPKSKREFLRLMASSWPGPISVPKPPGTFRILGLSDSFGTWGGISNYHYLLEDILRRDVAPTSQMINISVEGYDTLHELAILRHGIAYSPDLVVHGFFVGNDFKLYGDVMDTYTYLSIPVSRDLRTSRYRPRRFLIRAWIERALKALQETRRRERELRVGTVDRVGTFSKSAFLQIQFSRMGTFANRRDEAVDRMKKVFPVLDSIRAVAEGGGASYVMVIHPDQTQVDDKLRQDIITTFRVNEEEYDFDLPQQILRSYCEDRGIPCLDLLPSFRAKAKGVVLYLPLDSHYNHTGNALAATKISHFLQNSQFLGNIRQTTDGKVQAGQ